MLYVQMKSQSSNSLTIQKSKYAQKMIKIPKYELASFILVHGDQEFMNYQGIDHLIEVQKVLKMKQT